MILGSITLFIIALSVVYLFAVKKYASDKVWDWGHALMSTLVSVLLGVVAAFWVYNLQTNHANTEKKRELSLLLQEEFSDLHQVLSSKNSMEFTYGVKKYQVLITYIQPLIIEEAVKSGLYSAEDTKDLLHLSRKIRTYNLEVQFFISSIMSHPIGQQNRNEFAIRNIENTRRVLLSDLVGQAKNFGFTILVVPSNLKRSSPRTPL